MRLRSVRGQRDLYSDHIRSLYVSVSAWKYWKPLPVHGYLSAELSVRRDVYVDVLGCPVQLSSWKHWPAL